jgi:tetratricopeptide (TPR) repeat protein
MSGPNDLLREARERTPSRRAPGEHMSRSELADAICAWLWDTTEIKYELDGHYIAKLERGAVRWPGAAYRSGLRHVLGVAGDNDLGFFPPAGVIVGEQEPTPPASMADHDDDLVNAGDESIALLSFAEESNVGELTVEQLQADIERIAQSYLRTPIRPLFAKSRAIRDRAFMLLAGNQSPRQTRDLYSAAGWAITLLAWMSVDLGRPDIAEGHTRTAWACAEAADHDVLRGWIRATQHTAAFWQEDFARAAAYAEDGLQYAAGTSRLFLASAASVDLARAGQADKAREFLKMAETFAVRQEDSEPGGVFLCTPERAEGLWADTHLALGDARRTAAHADHSVALFEAVPYALRNAGSERMARLQQAKARLLLGQLDGALEAVDPILELHPEYRVRPLIHRLAEVAALATPYARSPKGRLLRDRIAEFTQRPGLPARPAASGRRLVREEQA